MKLAPLAALAAAFFCASALSATDPRFDAFMGRVVGNQTTVGFGSGGVPMATSSSHLGTPSIGNMTAVAPTGSGNIALQGRSNMPLPGKSSTVPVDVKVPITKANFGKALMLAGKVAWPVGVLMQAGDIYDYLRGEGYFDIKNTLDGVTASVIKKTSMDIPNEYQHTVAIHPFNQNLYPTKEAACIAFAASRSGWTFFNTNNDFCNMSNQTGYPVSYPFSSLLKPCPAGWDRTDEGCHFPDGGRLEVLTPQQLEDEIASKSGWPTSSTKALVEALKVPAVSSQLQTEPATVTGPATVPGQTTSTTESVKLVPGTNIEAAPGTTTPTDQGTKTTTKTESQKLTYSGNTVTTNSTVNNTTVTITNNTTNQTTVEGDKTEEIQDKEEPKEIETCGLPGKPACKIDETGTPEPKEQTAQKDTDDAIKPLDDFLKNPKAALPELPTINWAFTLPSGCSPIALPAFDPWLQEIDVCRFQPIFHDIMGFIWVMGGIFGAIGIFWRNTFSQG